MFKVLATFLIWLLVSLPCSVISVPVVAILLLTSWDGRSTIFGNKKWGRATNHFAFPTEGKYWKEFNWLVLRNPVNNLSEVLGAPMQAYTVVGDPGIGDKTRGGFYSITMGKYWEYYWIKPYGSRCIRVRIGWKINQNDTPVAYWCFVVSPFKTYRGV